MKGWKKSWWLWVILAAYLLVFFVLPVGQLFVSGIGDDAGRVFGGTLSLFLDNQLYL